MEDDIVPAELVKNTQPVLKNFTKLLAVSCSLHFTITCYHSDTVRFAQFHVQRVQKTWIEYIFLDVLQDLMYNRIITAHCFLLHLSC